MDKNVAVYPLGRTLNGSTNKEKKPLEANPAAWCEENRLKGPEAKGSNFGVLPSSIKGGPIARWTVMSIRTPLCRKPYPFIITQLGPHITQYIDLHCTTPFHITVNMNFFGGGQPQPQGPDPVFAGTWMRQTDTNHERGNL